MRFTAETLHIKATLSQPTWISDERKDVVMMGLSHLLMTNI